MRTFLMIWSGQLVSLLGSAMTGFAIGIWVYERTGSVTQFAFISLAAQLPSILLSPFVGALVDRWPRRRTMVLADCGALISTVLVLLLLRAEALAVWHILVLAAWSSSCNAFQSIAYSTSVALLLPKEHFGRATGMMQLAQSTGQLLAPVLGGALLVLIELQGIIVLDMSSFAIAVAMLCLIRIPHVPRDSAQKPSMKREIAEGWRFLSERRELLCLLLYFSTMNLFFVMGMTSFLPMVLEVASKPVAGLVLSIGGVGTLVGSLLMSAWGGPKRLVLGIFGFHLVSAVGLVLAGLQPSIPLIAVGVFLYSLGMPGAGACSQAIWLARTDVTVQGRVFAFRRMIGWGMLPLAYLMVGPLNDRVFEPLMAADGLLADTWVGALVGIGPGRGIGLLVVLLGMVCLVLVGLATRIRILRELGR